MSYEGREIFLCENNHVDVINIEDDTTNAQTICSICGAKKKNVGSIDDTNGEAITDTYLRQISPAVTQVCNLGHTHVVIDAKYEVIKSDRLGSFAFDHLDFDPDLDERNIEFKRMISESEKNPENQHNVLDFDSKD
jgi:hypothetical protein